MTRATAKDDGVRACLRPPMGNYASYSREYLATVRSCVMKAWPSSGPNAIKREVALTLLSDPELRLRICHLEDILRARQLAARQQVNGCSGPSTNGAHGHPGAGGGVSGAHAGSKDTPPVQLQTALADPSFAALFELDSSVNDPDWGMQVLWLNMTQLLKELGLPPPPPPSPSPPSPSAAPPSSPSVPAASLTHGSALPPAGSGGVGGVGSGGVGGVGSGSAAPTAPEASLLYGIEATFPNYLTDDDDYVAVATCFCLATRRDPKSLLPPLSLHLPDLCAHLCAFAALDPRLATSLQRLIDGSSRRGGSSGGGAPTTPQTLMARVSELLAWSRTRSTFRQSESLSRKGERVVSLAVEQLMRNAAGRAANGASRQPFANSGLPLEAWQRASNLGGGAGGVCGGNLSGTLPGGAAAATDGLPVFLFEYEAPGDLYGRDDMALPLAARRDQYGSTEGRASQGADAGTEPAGRPRASSATTVPPLQLAAASAAAGGGSGVGNGSGLRTAASVGVGVGIPYANQSIVQQQQIQLQHAWSDGSRSLGAVTGGGMVATAVALGAANPQHSALDHAASEPVPLPMQHMPVSGAVQNAVQAQAVQAPQLARRSTELNANAGLLLRGHAAGAGGGGVVDVLTNYASLNLAGLMSGWEAGKAAEGGLQGNGFGNGLRFPLLEGAVNGGAVHGGGYTEALFHHSLPAASAAVLAASPGGPTGELQVPQEIAEVWSNTSAGVGFGAGGPGAGAGSGVGAGGGGGGVGQGAPLAPRRSSVSAAATVNGMSSGLGPPDGGLGGVFAMSPTHESCMWDRAAPRSELQQTNAAAAVGRSGTTGVDLGAFVLNLGLGCPANGIGGGGAAASGGAGSFLVGSAPPSSMVPPFMHGPGGGLGGGVGLGLFDYSSWQSSSPELSSSVGGRSAPTDDPPAGSWLLAHGARVNGGCGGGGVSAAAAGRIFAASVAVATGGTSGGSAAPEASGAVVTARAATGPSPSMSEESEEAASVVGGLELDPVALTLEFIGLEQLEPGAVTRRTTLTSAGGAAAVMPAKGLIAAAAAPKTDAVFTATVSATPSGSLTPPSAKSLISSAPTVDGSSHSSLDSGEGLNAAGGGGGGGAAAAVLTGWSAMAARGPAPSPHPSTAGMQLAAAAAAAANGGRFVGSALPQHAVITHPGSTAVAQGLAATMAAMGAGGGGGSLALPRAGALGASAATAGAAPGMGLVGLGPGAVMGVAAVSQGASAAGAAAAARDVFGGKVLHPKLTARVREEICQVLRTVPGLKAEDFDDGVLHQLTLKKSEEEAVGALRTLASENLSGIQHMAAYINHIIKNYHLTGGPYGTGTAGAAAASLPSATVRANSTPVSSKAILQKLPLRVYRRLEEVINKCSYMEWKHFDAGVVKVMAQLAEIGEEDVFEELELLKSTDLSNVEYMPAYLNKRLNNRLWSRRKMLTSAAAAMGTAGP